MANINGDDLKKMIHDARQELEDSKKQIINDNRAGNMGIIDHLRNLGVGLTNEFRRGGKRIEERISSATEKINKHADEVGDKINEHTDKVGDKINKHTDEAVKRFAGRHSAAFIIIWVIIAVVVGLVVFAVFKKVPLETQSIYDTAGNLIKVVKENFEPWKCAVLGVLSGILTFCLSLLIPERPCNR